MLELRTSKQRSRPTERHHIVESAEQLSAIKRSKFDLCVWRRTCSPSFAKWLEAVSVRHELAVDLRGVRAERVDFGALLNEVAPGPFRDAWALDLTQVLAAYVGVFGDEPLRVQLSTIDGRKCPRFHVDSVGVRLLCTYAGPGTEWIPEAAVDRERLRACDAGEAPTRAGGRVEQLACFDVALMKGSAWPGNHRVGTVHRSPAVARDQRRLVFTVDTLRPPPRR